MNNMNKKICCILLAFSFLFCLNNIIGHAKGNEKILINDELIKDIQTYNISIYKGEVVTLFSTKATNYWASITTTSGNIAVPAGIYVPGASSYYVKLVQCCLKALGYNTGSVDGIYGKNTQNAIKKFQSSVKISADGIAGEMTWRKLNGDLISKGIRVPF